MVIRDDPTDPWRTYCGSNTSHDNEADIGSVLFEVVETTGATVTGIKRPRSPRSLSSTDVPEAKRPRESSGSSNCRAPTPDPIALKVLALCNCSNADTSLGNGDVFLTEGWRERWCRCSSVSSQELALLTCLHHSLRYSVWPLSEHSLIFWRKRKHMNPPKTPIPVYPWKNWVCVLYKISLAIGR